MFVPLVLSGCLSSMPELPGSGGKEQAPQSSEPEASGNLDMGLAALFQEDYAEARRLLTPVAEAGDAEAQYQLGVMFESGRGVARDYRQAAEWYRRAAEQGHVFAQT